MAAAARGSRQGFLVLHRCCLARIPRHTFRQRRLVGRLQFRQQGVPHGQSREFDGITFGHRGLQMVQQVGGGERIGQGAVGDAGATKDAFAAAVSAFRANSSATIGRSVAVIVIFMPASCATIFTSSSGVGKLNSIAAMRWRVESFRSLRML